MPLTLNDLKEIDPYTFLSHILRLFITALDWEARVGGSCVNDVEKFND